MVRWRIGEEATGLEGVGEVEQISLISNLCAHCLLEDALAKLTICLPCHQSRVLIPVLGPNLIGFDSGWKRRHVEHSDSTQLHINEYSLRP